MAELSDIRTQAETSVQDVAKLQESIPGLLSGLKSNLTSIFAKDNPLIQKREGLLADYLSIPERTSASLLPANMPMVAGSNLNLSPTQQSAIRASRSGAALAPLASLNDLIVGQYGNIGDILGNAVSLYQSQVEAGKTRSAGLMDLYGKALQEEKMRQDAQTSGGLGGDIAAIIAALGQGQDADAFLDSLVEPEQYDNLLPNIMQYIASGSKTPGPGGLDLGGREPAASAQLRFTL